MRSTKPNNLPPRTWSQPIRTEDTTEVTVVPLIKHHNAYTATSRYADLYWTPIIGPNAAALLRWASHQTGPTATTEVDLGNDIGCRGLGQIRRAIDTLVKHDLASITGTTIHVTISLPKLSRLQVHRFGHANANRHDREASTKMSTSVKGPKCA